MILRYPALTHLQSGSVCHAFTTAMDIVPTFLELAGLQHPNPSPASSRSTVLWQGRHIFPVRGKSWIPYLRDGVGQRSNAEQWDDDVEAVYGPNDTVVAWEHFGKCGLRLGRWKIVNMPTHHPTGTGKWQLYDMYTDQGETLDLANKMPEKLNELVKAYEVWSTETGAPLHTSTAQSGEYVCPSGSS